MLIKSVDKVQKLTRRVEDLYDQKEAEEKRHEYQEARLKLVLEAPAFTKTDFWCKTHGDTSGMAYKVSFKDMDLGWCAYYETFDRGKWPKEITACCKRLRRRITDKLNDPYYYESKMLKLQRAQAKASGDLLQPGDEGFKTKWGDPNLKLYEKMEAEEREKFNQRKL